jgi:hypothetical protein
MLTCERVTNSESCQGKVKVKKKKTLYRLGKAHRVPES